MRPVLRPLLGLLILIALLAPLAPGVPATHARQATPAPAAAVKASPSQLMVTTKGFTLYVFAKDKPNVSNCYGSCAAFWPPMLVPMGTQPAATVSGMPGKFGVTTRKDGSRQLTYDKAPLYTFLKDKNPGDVYGQGLFASGGFWWAIVVPGGTSSGYSS